MNVIALNQEVGIVLRKLSWSAIRGSATNTGVQAGVALPKLSWSAIRSGATSTGVQGGVALPKLSWSTIRSSAPSAGGVAQPGVAQVSVALRNLSWSEPVAAFQVLPERYLWCAGNEPGANPERHYYPEDVRNEADFKLDFRNTYILIK